MLKQTIFPQKVEVINQNGTSENPQKSEITNLPLNGAGTRLLADVTLTGGAASIGQLVKPTSGNYNVHVDSLFIVDSSVGTTVVVPLGSNYYNLSPAQISSMESGFHNLNVLYPATVRAYVIYSKISYTSVAEQIVYSLQ